MSTIAEKSLAAPGRSRQEEMVAKRAEEILEIATAVFAAEGFANADVQRIADQAGVGKGTVYRHFQNKEGLFLAAAAQGLARLRAAIDAVADPLGDPLDQLRGAVRTFLAFFDDHPEVVELMIQERAHFRDRLTPTFFGPRTDERARRWQERMQQLIARGIVRNLPVEGIMETMGEFLYGAVFVNYFGRRERRLSERADQLLDAIFHGILTPREADHAS
jgi:AcrR family transcriptional regulator